MEQGCKTRVKRFTTDPFPAYAHIPGQTPHPNKKGGHSFGLSPPECVGMEEEGENNRCFWFGVDLYNHAYYWEAHVWWEALWLVSRENRALDGFFKGLIKVAAGSLKWKMGQRDTALDLWQKARGLLLEGRGPLVPPLSSIPWEPFFRSLEEIPHTPLPLEKGEVE